MLIISDVNGWRKKEFFYQKALDSTRLRWYFHYFISDTVKVNLLVDDMKKEKEVCTIDLNGQCKNIKLENNTGKFYYYQYPNYPFPIFHMNSNQYIIPVFVYYNNDGIAVNDYHINTNSRLFAFSNELLAVVKIDTTQARIVKGFGRYPEVFLDTNLSFYNFFPDYMVKDSTIYFIFHSLDTIYGFNMEGKLKKYVFESRYKKEFKNFDRKELFNYDYISRYTAESSISLYIKTNSLVKQNYIFIKKPVNYVNKDKTVNNPKNNPFSIIVFNDSFKKLVEVDFSKAYVKHGSFAYGKGIAIRNKDLTTANKDKFATYVLFKTIQQ